MIEYRKYGLVTCIDGNPIGFVTWDPRNRPEYVEIGHNAIRTQYKGKGYSNFIVPKNYESVGFCLYDRKMNETESAYTGDCLYYEIKLG